MSQGTAPKRSIDEIIGSIRSIMDRSEEERAARARAKPVPVATEQARSAVANDDAFSIPDDLTDLPDIPPARTAPKPDIAVADDGPTAFAEPAAPQRDVKQAAIVEEPEPDEDVEAAHQPNPAPRIEPQQMAEIAAVVSRNIEEAEPSVEDSIGQTIEEELTREFATIPNPVAAHVAAKPTFGRRKTPASTREAAGSRRMDDLDAEFGNVIEPVQPAKPTPRHNQVEPEVIAPAATVVEPPRAEPHADERFSALHSAVSRRAEAPQAMLQHVSAPIQQLPVVPADPLQSQFHALGDRLTPNSAPLIDEAVLRPIVREWLDDNLPPMVERLVREELQRAIGGKS